MAKKRYDEATCLRLISRGGKCLINYQNHMIEVDTNNTPGIHTWGKIDYLCHFCGWRYLFKNFHITPKATQKVTQKSDNDNQERKKKINKVKRMK